MDPLVLLGAFATLAAAAYSVWVLTLPEAMATVLDVKSKSRNTNTVSLSYEVDGKPMDVQASFAASAFVSPGQLVTVHYQREHPERVSLGGFWGLWGMPLLSLLATLWAALRQQ